MKINALKPILKLRAYACGIHLAISLLIAIALIFFLNTIWYPEGLLDAFGGQEIFFLMIGIDVVLGPLCTFIVFNPAKKSLKFDLLVISLCQISALGYGVSTLYEARPAYIAALGSEFQVVQASEVTDGNLDKAHATLPVWGPELVGVRAPRDKYEINQAKAMASFGGGAGHLPQLHIPYRDSAALLLKNATPAVDLIRKNPAIANELTSWLASHDLQAEHAKCQPVKIGSLKYTAVIDAQSAKFIGIAPVVFS
ncbi:hypothetical protein G4G28_22505 [Massilia sp. Dwa41.01b]|uniref:hypothetical protein n=1 Tax=unclassified Massilia TaxID=2609279 RepID=UPI0015FEFAAE|nr:MULTISPECIES: hypothetical protein [unclassified Massilia]QNA90579.1 hypothetical protein G4G28_22505 [Massilia sp. Dwa41.01b]QNA97810.1 hypothetical protein G4G31_01585 [Massilia sp. Se16.2.3]